MSDHFISLASLLTRAWTRVYTAGLPRDERDARLAEIESDLWESAHDGDDDPMRLAVEIAGRLASGIPYDLAWRFARVSLSVPRVPAGAATATLASLVFSGFVASASGPASSRRS